MLPGTTGTMFVQAATAHLKASVGVLLAVSLVAAFSAGSRLFVTLENCFGIIFRLRGRDPLRQNRMAVGTLALNLVVVPLVFLLSILPANLITRTDPAGTASSYGILIRHPQHARIRRSSPRPLVRGRTAVLRRHLRLRAVSQPARGARGARTGWAP